MPSSLPTYIRLKARKPQGGFLFLTVHQLCLLWWLYRTRRIRLLDYRVWHACQELVARRCTMSPAQVPVYTLPELRTLVGRVGGAPLRASLRRLAALGLLTWSPTNLAFATGPQDLHSSHDVTGFQAMLAAIPNHSRRVPVPRRTIRLIAGGVRPAVIATILGYLCRCLYYHASTHHCVSGGWAKCSWIADVFHVHLRTVKAARRHLTALGWLTAVPTPQRVANRWGLYAQVSLTWKYASDDVLLPVPSAALASSPLPPAQFSPTKRPPRPDLSPPQLPPPLLHTEPLQERTHQKPAMPTATTPRLPSVPCHPPSPVSDHPEHPGIWPDQPAKTSPPASPTLHHIVPEDLTNMARLLTLFDHATTHHLIGPSEHDRLTFVALAEHALAHGTWNPGGLFATLLRRQQWEFITDGDDLAAQRRMKQYLYGTPTRATPSPARESPGLSPDAAVVRTVRTQAARAGWPGEGFGLVRHADPTWTRARWDQAVAELERAQQAWRRAQTLHPLEACLTPGECLDDEAEDAA